MTRLFLLAFWLAMWASVSHAGWLGDSYWLDEVTEANRANWEGKGFGVHALDCANQDPSCVLDALETPAPNRQNVLVLSGAYAGLVGDILKTGVKSDLLAGIVLLRATGYDKLPSSSGEAPKLLVLAGSADAPQDILRSRRFASSVNDGEGIGDFLIVRDDTLLGGATAAPLALSIIWNFLGYPPKQESLVELLAVYKAWRTPPFQNKEFYNLSDLISERPMTERLKLVISDHFSREPFLAHQWAFETYKAFDLLAYRDIVAPGARYVRIRNIRNQLLFLDLETYAQYKPKIVVGIDERRNMYELSWFYKTRRQYTWMDDAPEYSVRLLGPMLYFEEDILPELIKARILGSSFGLGDIEFLEEDPLAEIAGYSDSLKNVLTKQNRCINCHAFGGFDAAAYHINATTGEPQGGVGLPLKDYTDPIMHAFLFNQESTAFKIGMTPNPLPTSALQEFYEWYQSLRGEGPAGASPAN
jgi:hypothetical protein